MAEGLTATVSPFQVMSQMVPKAGYAASLTLHAIPSSVKATIGRNVRASFQTLLTTPKPEHVGPAMAGDMIWNMPMSCTYNG